MTNIMTPKFILCRSNEGDGGWSLHAPGSSDEDIATGDAPYITCGPAEWDEEQQFWDRPNADDYEEAERSWKEGALK